MLKSGVLLDEMCALRCSNLTHESVVYSNILSKCSYVYLKVFIASAFKCI